MMNFDEDRESQDELIHEDDWTSIVFTPLEAPVHGGQSIFVSCGGHLSPLRKGITYFLLFEGSNLRHITSAKYVNPFTLQAIIPDHDVAETVDLSITVKVKEQYTIKTTSKFTFTLDMSILLAQSLMLNATNSAALKQIESMYNSLLNVSSDEQDGLDQRLVLAFKQLHLSESWSLYDKKATWTLLHLCAKYDLFKLGEYLVTRNGASQALLVRDEGNFTPMDIASANENIRFMELFSRSPIDVLTVENEAEESKQPTIRRHNLGTTTITASIADRRTTFEHDAKLLEDLQNLASESKKNAKLKHSSSMEGNFSHPLANSLQKLREINLEIQRLRCLTQTDNNQVTEMYEKGRMRSYSCPNGFDTTEFDGNAHICRQHSTSLAPCDEEDGELKQDDSNSPETASNKGEFEKEAQVSGNDASSSVEECDMEDDGISFDGTHESTFVVIESVTDEGPAPDNAKDTVDNVIVIDAEVDDDVNQAAVDAGLDNVASVSTGEDSSFPDTLTHSDADESCVKGTVEECSDVDMGGLGADINLADESLNDTPKVDVASNSEEVGETGTEEHDGVKGNEIAEIQDASACADSLQQESIDNFEEFRSNSLVSEARMLTAVTEETEEELLELDGKAPADLFVNKSHSLEELKTIRWSDERMHHSAEQVNIVKGVSLRKGILKKDRPLSDNYENMKMIARDSQTSRFVKQPEFDNGSPGLDKRKSKSLDLLLVDDDDRKSPSLTSSQLSLSDIHGSIESMDLVEAPSNQLYVAKNSGSGSLGHRASLNDIALTVRDDIDEPPPMMKKIRSRFSFKRKSKSTTALDKKGVTPKDDDRRKTIMGGISTERLFSQRKADDYERNKKQTVGEHSRTVNRDSGIDSTYELRLDDMLLTTSNGHNAPYTRSQSEYSGQYLNSPVKNRNRSSSELSAERDTEDDDLDVDTDEGTSSEIAEMVRKTSATTEEKKKEKKFGLLRKGKKDKKHAKDKEKEAAEKALKKSHRESKSFLGKKPSFRQGSKASVTSLGSDSKMFARGSSGGKPGSAPTHSASMDNLKGSVRGRPSPTANRRTIHEYDMVDGLELPSNLTSTLSSSLGSLNLEEVADAPFNVDDLSQYDSDLDIKNEPETWSDLVEKKVHRKLHAKDIKRQDVIYELIYTESNYVRTLKIVSRIYSVGLRRELGMDDETIEALFPRLDDLLEINGTFCDMLKRRQTESNNNVIEEVGDLLVDQFGGLKGDRMKEVYGYFCSRHLQAVALYKELMKTDKKFALFVRKCMLNERVRRLSIPECITLATQRLTKYPLLFEAILKATKESKSDYENVKKSIRLVKNVLMAVDDAVRDYEKQQQLSDMKRKFDLRGEIQYKNGIFKNSKLFGKRSILIHEGSLLWKGRSKPVDVKAVLLADKIFFCHEKDQKYSLVSVDSKPPVIYLKSLLAREVATDKCSLFLVNNEGPEMYELVCSSQKSKDQWMLMINEAVKNRPDDDEEFQSDLEEEMRKEEESRVSRLKEVIEKLQVADYQFVNLIAEKNKLVVEMKDLIEKIGSTSKNSSSELTATDVLEGRETLEKAITEASSLTALLYDSDINIQSEAQHPSSSTTVPKRAETFGGFDRNPKSLAPPIHVSRASSLKQENRLSLSGKTQAIVEPDHGPKDPKERVRKTSQGFMSVIGRNKPNESNEDLSSLSSSNSNLSHVSSTSAQKLLAITRLKEYLSSLMDITNKQDIELASLRVELHSSQVEMSRLKTERKNAEDKLIQQQKDLEKQLGKQKDVCFKLERTVEKLNRQIIDYKHQQQTLKELLLEQQKRSHTSEHASKANSLSSMHRKHHTMQENITSNANHGRAANSQSESDERDVIFF